jgi:hypothetical protein
MPELTAQEARRLAATFRRLSSTLGEYRFDQWDALTEEERQRIENIEWTLLNYSSDFIAEAIVITADRLEEVRPDIERSVAAINDVIGKVDDARTLITIATKASAFGAAVATGNLGAIAEAAGGLAEVARIETPC